MATLPIPASPPAAEAVAAERAAQRLQAWEARHPAATMLAVLASLAVRIDRALLRRLRLQLLPRAEPGIEADLWFSGLHASRGRDAVVLDPAVQRLLRTRLAQLPAAAGGGPRPLDRVWALTAALHADHPEALRTEEALTHAALGGGRQDGGADLPARIEALLAPALAAMAGGGEARALEVARWAQRAVPQLPDAARSHPSALALWLAALMRLGLPASQLPDTGGAGLPPALPWLLPAGQVQALQRVALQAFDDTLLLQPLDDGAAAAASELTLPRTRPLLLALRIDAAEAGAAPLLQRTLALDAAAAETRVPLPPGWQALDLHSLTGARWRLQRAAGPAPDALPRRPWFHARVQVLGPSGPVGMGCFVSPTEIVTVLDLLQPDQLAAVQQGTAPARPLTIEAWDAEGDRLRLQARVQAADLRSALVLLRLQRPVAGAPALRRRPDRPAVGEAGWTVAGLSFQASEVGRIDGRFTGSVASGRTPAGRPLSDDLSRHVALQFPPGVEAPAGLAGAPVFTADAQLAGIVDLGTQTPDGAVLWAVPAAAVDRFLGWAQTNMSEWPPLLLHHPVDDPYGKGAEIDERAVQRIEAAARRARMRLLQRDAAQPARSVIDDADDPAFGPDLAGVVRLVTPVTREGSAPAARLRLLALAARRWAQPHFGVLTLGFRRDVVNEAVPLPLASAPRLLLDKLDDETLARALLDMADPPVPAGAASPEAARAALHHRLAVLARPFQPSTRALSPVRDALDRADLPAVADLVIGRWNISSRLDAVPLVELMAMLALPVAADDNRWLAALDGAERGARVLNAMPAQFGRLLLARAHGGDRVPPCVVVRAQAWEGATSIVTIETLVVATIAAALHCTADEAGAVMQRVELPLWVLVTTRPLPERKTLLDLELRLPAVRWLFLAGDQPDLAEAARAIGADLLPPIEPGADLRWLQGYKRLMEWARPRQRSSPSGRPKAKHVRKPTRK